MSDNDFFNRVYDVVKCIPAGRVTTYGAIAKYLSAAKASRMVGWAMNASHKHDCIIPAHRVVNRNGFLTGKRHFGDIDLMQQLLCSEGVDVHDDKVVDFSKKFWDPATEPAP